MPYYVKFIIKLFGLKEAHEDSDIREDDAFKSRYESDLPYLLYLIRQEYVEGPWFENKLGKTLYKLENSYLNPNYYKRKFKKKVISSAGNLIGEELRPVTRVGERGDNMFSSAENRDPEYLVEEEGWDDFWGDAAVNSPYFIILRREITDESGMYETGGGEFRPGPEGERAEFKILCPTFLRRPVTIVTDDADAWGGY